MVRQGEDRVIFNEDKSNKQFFHQADESLHKD